MEGLEHPDCDGGQACEDADDVASQVYTATQPPHSHAHYMNENPCGFCDHGARYHHGNECIVPGCDCLGEL